MNPVCDFCSPFEQNLFVDCVALIFKSYSYCSRILLKRIGSFSTTLFSTERVAVWTNFFSTSAQDFGARCLKGIWIKGLNA